MKYVTLCHIKPGMVLARPICNANGITLLGKNVSLTEHFCEKIQELACAEGIYVYDEFDLIDKQEFKDVVNEETRMRKARNNELFDLDAISFFATSIVTNARNSSEISHLMLELNNYSKGTFEHSIRVAEISVVMGIGMGYKNSELSNLALAALLHDIGKTKVDKSILRKTSSLTPNEKSIMNQHPLYGYELVKSKPRIDATVKCGILMHHENEDGSGYPKGIKGNAIYKFAKIIHIADVFDAMISKRSYKKEFTRPETIEYMMSMVGTMFDEQLFHVFMNYIEVFKVGDVVILSTDKDAIVTKNHPKYMLRPTILVDNETIDLHSDRNALNIVILDKKEQEQEQKKEND